MARVSPYHSTYPSDHPVYHNQSTCVVGNNIERRYLAAGTAGRPLCLTCSRMS